MKNWKTTLLGILGALAIMLGGALQKQADPAASPVSLQTIINAVAVAALGAAAKDHDSTGGKR